MKNFPGEAPRPPSFYCITPSFSCPRPTQGGGGLSNFVTGSRGGGTSFLREQEGGTGRVIFSVADKFNPAPVSHK